VAEGSPEHVASVKGSYTGLFLREILDAEGRAAPAARKRAKAKKPTKKKAAKKAVNRRASKAKKAKPAAKAKKKLARRRAS
jgi:excinuclease ABC subunit A